MGRLKFLRSKVSFWLVPLVAAAMLALMLVPVQFWHRPANDAVYRGFDANLLDVQEKGNAPYRGIVEISRDSLTLTASPFSQPNVDLMASPLDFRLALDVLVLESAEGSEPLRIGVWSPRKRAGHYLTFGPPPENLITTETLLNGAIPKSETLGTYSPGQLYHLEVSVDREEGVLQEHISSDEGPFSRDNMVLLTGGPWEPGYREVQSEFIPVRGGGEYTFGGEVKLISGTDTYKLVVEWFDREKKHISWANDWRPVKELRGWTGKEFEAAAPSEAAFAKVILGAGNGRSRILMTDLFFRPAREPEVNLLSNGDFRQGPRGWLVAGATDPAEQPQIVEAFQGDLESSLTVGEVADLFLNLPLAVTVSSSSEGGISTTVLENYSLTLPSQRWMAMPIDDGRATGLLLGLLTVGSLMCITVVAGWVIRKVRQGAVLSATIMPVAVEGWHLLLGVGVAVLVYFVLNSLLFGVGYHPYDMTTEKVWSYVASQYGPTQLYHLPAVVSPAKVWGGIPFASAAFPYQPVMAYIFTAVGWVSRLFLADAQGLRMDGFQLEFVIKGFNALFGLAAGVLIYLILRRLDVSQRASLLASALFLFNPAVWFVMSIWGETHTISLFFLLASIWMAQRRAPFWAWLALAGAGLTRPQMLVPAFLLGLIYLRMFPLKENVLAISWSVIVGFLLLAPLTVAISPSLPVDVAKHTIAGQNPSGSGAGEYYFVSFDAYNVWPLVTGFLGGESGKDRIYYPGSTPLAGPLTYNDIGDLAFFALFLVIVVSLLFRRGRGASFGDYLPLVAAGMLALLVLRTGISSHHFLLALPLVILCRGSLRNALYYCIVALLTLTTLVSTYGSLGFATSQVEQLAPRLFYGNNPVTRFMMDLFAADWFITVASIANLLVLACLAWVALGPLPAFWRRRRRREVVVVEGVAALE